MTLLMEMEVICSSLTIVRMYREKSGFLQPNMQFFDERKEVIQLDDL